MSVLRRDSSFVPARLTRHFVRRLGRTRALVVALLGLLGATLAVGAAVRAAVASLAPPAPARAGAAALLVDPDWPPNDDDVYGPHTVSATSWDQVWYFDNFSIKPMPVAKYFVKVRTPSATGGSAVPNFSVKLNGVYYATKDSLKNGATTFEKQVPLQTWNRIELWIAPGSGKIDLSIYASPKPFRTLDPVKEIMPLAGQSSVTKTWQVTKPADAGPQHVLVIENGNWDRTKRVGPNEYGKIRLNGSIVFDVDTFHTEQSKAVVPVTLQAGVNTIEVTAGNMGDGGERFYVRAAYADTAKPKLVVNQPAQNAVIGSTSVTVSGTYQDSTWGYVFVGSASSFTTLTQSGNGGVKSWSTTRSLSAEGANTIKVWSKDASNNKTDTLVRTVIRDTQQPTLTVSAPAEGFSTNQSSVTVTASASDANGVTVTANGVTLAAQGGGSYSGSVPLNVGPNAITVVATDAGGNTRTVVRNVTRSAPAVAIGINSPTEGFLTSAATVQVTAAVSGGTAPYTVTANGTSLSLDASGNYSGSVPLTTEGAVAITVIATDAVGGTKTEVRNIVRDATAPALVVNAPAEGTQTESDAITASGTVTDDRPVTLKLNDAPVTVTAGAFSLSVPLSVGPNTLTFVATDAANNTSRVTRSVLRQGAITVVVDSGNPGSSIDRDGCLTIAAGDGAAYECGDLRLAHALPTTRAMNKARTPTLIYNSRHAKPGALIAADVSLRAEHTPDTLQLVLRIPNKPDVIRKVGWQPGWSGGPARRIVVPVDARTVGLVTGAYTYTLEVTAQTGAANPPVGGAGGTLVIVDRSTSPFGAGWWLDGLEMLSDVTPSTNKLLWIGGDGSTRVYTHQQDSVWIVTPTVDRLDTLIDKGTGTARRFYRKLKNGAFVEFNSSYQHVATVNRQGHRTTFWHSAALDSIQLAVPAASNAQLRYRFNYSIVGDEPPIVDSVNAPSRTGEPRTVKLLHRPDRGITQITDPDNFWVGFKYDEPTGRMAGRRNRTNDTTFFEFDAAGLLKRVSVDMRRTNGDTATALATSIRPAESRSAIPGDDAPLLLDEVYTLLDGPRPDADVQDRTSFWLDRFGAPKKIVNAIGEETLVIRGDLRFPMLVTKTRGPGPTFFTVRAEYNGRGLIERQIAEKPLTPLSNDDATRMYTWLTRWDVVETITSPMGTVTRIGYFDNGDRKSQQVGPDERRVEFTYNADRQLETVKQPLTPPERLEYDPAHGNLKASVTPRGFRTEYIRDRLGRDSLTRTQIDVAGTKWEEQWLTHDIADLLRESRSVGPAVVNLSPEQTLLVSNDYDAEGRLLTVSRSSIPDPAGIETATTQFVYDAAGRKTDEIAPDGHRDTYRYDLASNLRFWTTRRNHTVEMRYDAVNRLERRLLPSVTYPAIAPHQAQTIPADEEVFTYDEAGRTRTANSNHAQVTRGYAPGGALVADTLRTAVYNAANLTTAQKFARHVYGVRYRYDLDGRRTALIHPGTIAFNEFGVVYDSVAYNYDLATGLLQWVQGPYGAHDRYHYTWDLNGRLDSLERAHGPSEPASRAEKYAYDDDGNMIRSHLHGNNHERPDGTFSTMFHADEFSHDARGKAISVRTLNDTTRYDYDGLGTVVFAFGWNRRSGEITTEKFTADAFTNVTELQVENDNPRVITTNTYQRLTGRLLTAERTNVPTSLVERNEYDDAGNRIHLLRRQVLRSDLSEFVDENTRSYYDATQRLAITHKRTTSNMSILPKEYAAAFEEYRYDALGRRILVRSLRAGCSSLCPSGIERYVWDGDQILFEIRRPVATVNDPPGLQGETDIEADSGKVYRLQFPEEDQDPETGEQLYPDTLYEMQAVGRVSYLHGVELDHPLVVDRLELGSDSAYRNLIRVWPFANWQGSYDNGTLSERCPESVCINPRWPGSLTTYQALSSVPPGDPRMWFGSLPSGMRDGSGQTFKRNRYYDATSGRFTQEDPIGLAGGLNLYGFASGDPVNLSDPFGLYTQIQCRTIPSTLGLAAHCGLRVINRRLRINRTIELTRVGDRNTFNNDKDVAQFDESGWMTLQPPGGMSEDEFDLKILGAYDAEARHYRKTHPYYSSGTCENSNRFIRNVVRRAGGAIPGGVDQRRRHWLFGAPGLRHGDCVYDTSPNHPRPLVWGNR